MGLPIGNLTSQFFANVYLNQLDQFVKHKLKAKYYIRYVDDAVILHENRDTLNHFYQEIEKFLKEKLLLDLKEKAKMLKPISSGINFLGYIVYPNHRLTRRRVVNDFEKFFKKFRYQLTGSLCFENETTIKKFHQTVNSYSAHFRKSNSYNIRNFVYNRNLDVFNHFR